MQAWPCMVMKSFTTAQWETWEQGWDSISVKHV